MGGAFAPPRWEGIRGSYWSSSGSARRFSSESGVKPDCARDCPQPRSGPQLPGVTRQIFVRLNGTGGVNEAHIGLWMVLGYHHNIECM